MSLASSNGISMVSLLNTISRLAPNFNDLLQTGIGLALISVMLTGVGLIAGWLLRKRGPIWRSMAYRCTIACLLIAGVLTVALSGRVVNRYSMVQPDMAQAWTPNNEPVVFHNTQKETTSTLPIQRTDAGTPTMPAAINNIPASPAVRPHTTQERLRLPVISFLAALIYLWIVGIAVGLLWLCTGALLLTWLHAKASVVNDNDLTALVISLSNRLNVTAPRVMVGHNVISPFLTGIWKPVIYLPDDYSGQYDPQVLRAIIAHELAHLANRDCLFLYLSRLSLLLFWINPLVWLLHKRLDLVSEEICDATVVTLDCPPAEYANSLLSLAERLRPTVYAFGIGVVPIKSTLGKRIKAILAQSGGRFARLSVKAKGTAVFISACALVLVLVALCPSRVINESKKTLIISLIGEYPEHYADNFTLAQKKGWSIGPAYCDNNPYYKSIDDNNITTWKRQYNVDNPAMAGLKLDINYNDLHRMLKLTRTNPKIYDESFTLPGILYSDIKKNIKTYTTDVIRQNPQFSFYIEDYIAGYYYEAKNLKNYRYWHNKSLDDAPAVLAGQVMLENGKPAGGYSFDTLIRFSNQTPQKSLLLQYSNVVTDSNGVYYIPIFKSDYKMSIAAAHPLIKGSPYNDMDQYISFREGDAYSNNRRVVMVPPVILVSKIKINGKWSHKVLKPTIVNNPVVNISWKPISHASEFKVSIYTGNVLVKENNFPLTTSNEIKSIEVDNNHVSIPLQIFDPKYEKNSRDESHYYELTVSQINGKRVFRNSDSIYFKTSIVYRTQKDDIPKLKG